MPTVHRIAVVSGKGGVGKTIISANFARLVSYNQRMLLLDFDFPNQGLSGLLSDFLRAGCFSARELIESSGTIDASRVLSVDENLLFIPAFDPADKDRFSFNTNQIHVTELMTLLDYRISALTETLNLDLILMDCHGGLDHISYASFRTSDYTIVVSEPDLVTFNGTLELFDYYIENWASSSPKDLPTGDTSFTETLARRDEGVLGSNKLIFLLNRLSGRFSYSQLLGLYERQLDSNFPLIAPMITRYVFVPSDGLLARSFSEFPFYIELLPESIFVQKLWLMYSDIFGARPRVVGRSFFFRLFERKRPRVLRKYIKSQDERRSQGVFAFYSAIQFGLLAGIITMGIYFTNPENQKLTKNQADILKEYPSAAPLVGTFFGLLFLGAAYVNVLIGQYYRDNLRYEYRLFRRGGREIQVTFLLRSIRMLASRMYLDIAACVFGLTAISYLIFSIVKIGAAYY